ncbi:MAG TPA: gliding motility-associated C-terminal domain-containing protein [Bacteroidia bacterium]
MKRHSRLFTVVLLLIFAHCSNLMCQREANTWRFENGLGIDFNQCPPRPLYNGANDVWESACSISDPETGELLFYTNTSKVFNRNHTVMKNGASLLGTGNLGVSTTQVTIVPHPNVDSAFLYFVFTLYPQTKSTKDSLKCHVVDMRQDGGLGAVVRRGICLLPGPLNEKIVAIRAPDKKSFRIVVHGNMNNDFYAIKVDEDGLDYMPVKSTLGKVNAAFGTLATESVGSLVASPDGNKLCYLSIVDKSIQLYHFDYATGVVSDYLNINTPNPLNYFNAPNVLGGFYGGSFSPDSKKLYVATSGSNYTDNIAEIYQFDVSNWDQVAIENSVYTVVRSVPEVNNSATRYINFKHLKLGPDGKIYIAVSNYYTPYTQISNPNAVTLCLPAILYPDSLGKSCKYVSCHVAFNPASVGAQYKSASVNTGVYQTWSLNNLYEQLDYPKKGRVKGKKQKVTCQERIELNPVTRITASDAHFKWSDGSTERTLKVYKRQQYFWVDIMSQGCDTIRDTFVLSPRQYKKGKSATLCLGKGVILSPQSDTSGVTDYLWSNGSNTYSTKVTVVDTFYLSMLTNCDSIVDTYIVEAAKRKIGKKTEFCERSRKWIKPISNINQVYTNIWSTAVVADSIVPNRSGVYWVDQISPCDTIRDSFIVVPPVRKVGKKQILCIGNGKSLKVLSDTQNVIEYIWKNAVNSSTIQVNGPGIYWLDMVSYCDTVRDSFIVNERNINKGSRYYVCLGNGKKLTINRDTALHHGIRWSNGSNEHSIVVSKAGTYTVQVKFECEVYTDTFVLESRKAIRGKTQRFCPGQTLNPLSKMTDSVTYLWNTGSTDSVIVAKLPGIYHLRMVSDCYVLTDSFEVSVTKVSGLFEAADTWLCGKSLVYHLRTDTSLNQVVWKFGPIGAEVTLTGTGRFPFVVRSKDQCSWDSGAVVVRRTPNAPSFIESAFTPDNNGINETFPRMGLFDRLDITEISVFDRWGSLIYSSQNLPWDGRLNDEVCQEGVYYCRIVYRNCDYIQRHWYGTFTLLR